MSTDGKFGWPISWNCDEVVVQTLAALCRRTTRNVFPLSHKQDGQDERHVGPRRMLYVMQNEFCLCMHSFVPISCRHRYQIISSTLRHTYEL